MDGNLSQAFVILFTALATAVAGVITALSTKLISWLTARTKSNEFDRYLRLLNETVVDVVMGLNQTIVDRLKAAAQDGKLTKEEIEDISGTAKNTILEILGENAVLVLSEVFDDLESLIASKIERVVMEVKR